MHTNENNNNAFLYNNNGAGEGVDTYFTFSFTYEFMPNQDDEVWFAHAVPSNYTQMQESLLKLRNAEEYKDNSEESDEDSSISEESEDDKEVNKKES